MENLELEISGTEAGVKTVRVRHPGGRDTMMRVLRQILPAIEQLDRTIRAEPTPST